MSESAAITIRRQVLDVEVEGTEVDGLALQRRLPAWCADVLRPALHAELARVDPGDGCLYVEHLEVEVSISGLDRLEDRLVEAVCAGLADFFRRHPTHHPPASGPPWSGPGAGALEVRSLGTTVDDALVEFLRTGRLPWAVRLPPGVALEQYVVATWNASAPGGMPPPSLARLSEALVPAASRQRLVLQFTPSFVGRLLRAWAPEVVARVEDVLRVVDQNPSAPERAGSPAAAGFTRALWETALAAAAEGRTPAAHVLARTAWEGAAEAERDDRAAAALLESRWPGVTGSSGAPSRTATGADSGGATAGAPSAAPAGQAGVALGGPPGVASGAAPDGASGGASGPASGGRSGAASGEPSGAASGRPRGATSSGASVDASGAASGRTPGVARRAARSAASVPAPGAAPSPARVADAARPAGGEMRRDGSRVEPPSVSRDGGSRADEGREDAVADQAGGILVDHAGLVLLHPFLPRFFEALGVAAGDELLDPARALCLLAPPGHGRAHGPRAPAHRGQGAL